MKQKFVSAVMLALILVVAAASVVSAIAPPDLHELPDGQTSLVCPDGSLPEIYVNSIVVWASCPDASYPTPPPPPRKR